MLNLDEMLRKLYAMKPEELTARLCKVLDESGISYVEGEGQIEFERLLPNTGMLNVTLDGNMFPSEPSADYFAIDDYCLAA